MFTPVITAADIEAYLKLANFFYLGDDNPCLMSSPERIRAWAQRNLHAECVDSAVCDLIDVASGNRAGTRTELKILNKIFPEWRMEV